MLTQWIQDMFIIGWYRLTHKRRAQTSADAASRQTAVNRARFWAELRQGRREAATRARG
jgi:hypothetical protein